MSASKLCTEKYVCYHQVVNANEARKLEVKPAASTVSSVSTCASSLDTATAAASNDVIGEFDVSSLSGEEAVRVAALRAFRRHAFCIKDLRTVARFAEIIGLRDVCVNAEFARPVLRALKLLHLCDYGQEDICTIMAHASVYFTDAFDLCGSQMDASEIGNVAITLFFIAHSYTQDETCPLHVWHQHLFRRYCNMATLNAALFRLLEIRGFMLRVEDADLIGRYGYLMAETKSWSSGQETDDDDGDGDVVSKNKDIKEKKDTNKKKDSDAKDEMGHVLRNGAPPAVEATEPLVSPATTAALAPPTAQGKEIMVKGETSKNTQTSTVHVPSPPTSPLKGGDDTPSTACSTSGTEKEGSQTQKTAERPTQAERPGSAAAVHVSSAAASLPKGSGDNDTPSTR